MTAGPARPRRIVSLTAAALGLLVLLGVNLGGAIHARGLGAADDAFISYRMARNLGDGHGLRFNPDGPPIEAASNFLLTVMLAGAHVAGLSLVRSSITIALVSTVLTLLLLLWCVRRHVGPWAIWAPFALAAMSVTCRSVTNGLETSLFGLLVLLGIALYIEATDRPRPRRRLLAASSAVFALVALTRPEGPMYIVALGVLRLADLLRRRARGEPLDLTTELYWVGGFAALFVPYTIWRVAYFGALLPNTFHAKELQFGEVGKLGAGLRYLQLMVLTEPLLPLSVVAGLLAHAAAPCRRIRALLALVMTQLVFMVLSGGDWPHMFGYGRFLYPALAPMLWLLAEAGRHFARLLRRGRPVVASLALALLGVSQVDLVRLVDLELPPHYHFHGRAPTTWQAFELAYVDELPRMPTREWIERSTQAWDMSRYHNNFDATVGLWLRDHYGPKTRIAAIQAGQFAYWAEMPFYDLFGLVTREVVQADDPDPDQWVRMIKRFDPELIAFYKWNQGVHHRPLVLSGKLWKEGYGLRFVFQRKRFRAFVVFEKGYESPEDPNDVLFAPMADLPRRVDPERWIAALDANHPWL